MSKAKIKAKKHNFSPIWYVLGIGSVIIILLFIVSSVINVGEKFERIPKVGNYVEIGFYIIVALLVWLLVFNPIRVILTSPSLDVITTFDESSRKYNGLYKKVAKNIVKNNDLPEEDVKLLTEYKNVTELRLNLQTVFDRTIKKQLNDIIISHAKTVMISTAISQNARVDMFTVYAVNLRLIKSLVEKCGFRPSYKNLSKLAMKVTTCALIADGLQSLSLDEILPKSALGPLQEIPFIKPIMSSVIQGTSNALLTLRIGMVTRKYLFKDGNDLTREDIRKSAWKESVKLIPLLVADVFTFVPKKAVKLFGKKNNEEAPAQIEG